MFNQAPQLIFRHQKFPGLGAISNDPLAIMEWASMADGVAYDEVYSIRLSFEIIGQHSTELSDSQAVTRPAA